MINFLGALVNQIDGRRTLCKQRQIPDYNVNFILTAKRSVMLSGGVTLLPYRLGSRFTVRGEWACHDSLGRAISSAKIVYFQGKVVWGMNYFGRILGMIRSPPPGRAVISRACQDVPERAVPGWIQHRREYEYTGYQ
jgi:hypothetical protein